MGEKKKERKKILVWVCKQLYVWIYLAYVEHTQINRIEVFRLNWIEGADGQVRRQIVGLKTDLYDNAFYNGKGTLTDPASNSYVSGNWDCALHVHNSNLTLQHFQPSHADEE